MSENSKSEKESVHLEEENKAVEHTSIPTITNDEGYFSSIKLSELPLADQT